MPVAVAVEYMRNFAAFILPWGVFGNYKEKKIKLIQEKILLEQNNKSFVFPTRSRDDFAPNGKVGFSCKCLKEIPAWMLPV